MTDYYKTNKEVLREVQEEANKYIKLKNKIRKEIKRHRTLEQATENEDYKLAHSMVADCLEELKEDGRYK